MDRIKSKAFEISRWTASVWRSIHRYFLFILQIIGWVLVLYFLTPFLASLLPLVFKPQAQISLSDFILLITAAFVLAYTYQTQKLKEETIFQRRMAAAHDIRFRMNASYVPAGNNAGNIFGALSTPESLNNVCEFVFVTALVGSRIGRSDTFDKVAFDQPFLRATYFIESQATRDAFLRSLQLAGGEIRARVSVTNGEKFIYTFKAVTDNWRRSLAGAQNLNDEFILVKKDIDET